MPDSHTHHKKGGEFCQSVYILIHMIPKGCVSSYGDIAKGVGYPGHARRVAYCLRLAQQNGEKNLPWFRVVRSNLRVAFPAGSLEAKRQLALLQKEGEMLQGERVAPARRWQSLI